MLLGWLVLSACVDTMASAPSVAAFETESDEVDGADPTAELLATADRALLVDVAARVGHVGSPAGWSAQATWASAPESPPLPPGTCRPAGSARERGGRSARGADTLAITGPTPAALAWDGSGRVWTALGPRQSLDPAWSVSDLVWTDAAGEHRAEDVVRFGGLPAVTRVTREREGHVALGWDPDTVEAPTVLVLGPGGLLECGVGPDGVVLPWWAVPAYQGEVVLRSRREASRVVDGVLVRVRTTLERVVPLDRPAWTTAEEDTPAFSPYSQHSPRRLLRRPRTPLG